jgi:hypothetical protein
MRFSNLFLAFSASLVLVACGLETEPSSPDPAGAGGNGARDGGSGSGGSGAGGDSGTTGGRGGTGGSTGGTGGTSGTGGTGGSTGGSGGTGGSTDCDSDEECPASSPKCDEGECVPCTSSASCEDREATPFCEATTGSSQVGECVACLEDDHCEGSDDGAYCNNNECVPCKTHADCTDLTKPQCSDEGQCVGCTDSDACEDRDGAEICVTSPGPRRGACVACLENEHCDNPTPQCTDNECTKCTNNEACSDRDGTTVCDTSSDATFGGTCVECTGSSYETCKEGSTEYVCVSLERECSNSTDHIKNGTDVCGECVSDAECMAGQLCVMQTFDDPTDSPDVGDIEIGFFCTWKKNSGAPGAPVQCVDARPYSHVVEDIVSLDGSASDICTLGTYTCPALMDHNSQDCAAAGTGSDELCGHPEAPHDGFCRLKESGPPVDIYRCTTPCSGDDDCQTGKTCLVASTRVCTF